MPAEVFIKIATDVISYLIKPYRPDAMAPPGRCEIGAGGIVTFPGSALARSAGATAKRKRIARRMDRLPR